MMHTIQLCNSTIVNVLQSTLYYNFEGGSCFDLVIQQLI